ncbi:SpoIIE family protein phosphatase [Streptodolium elevatio]|uniref:SpoIIE family protein phosphatase n=1 Tax=Streptodolium elevatio TaxID=3157996 RepID=A0ABV3DB91_9ACTN
MDRLRAEVDGLRRAMRSRAVIEQAKGLLMARMSCSADEAFGHLAQLSQHTNMKLAEVAAGLLGVAAPPSSPAVPRGGSPGTGQTAAGRTTAPGLPGTESTGVGQPGAEQSDAGQPGTGQPGSGPRGGGQSRRARAAADRKPEGGRRRGTAPTSRTVPPARVHPAEEQPGTTRTPLDLSSEEAARYHLVAAVLETADDGDDMARLLCEEALGSTEACMVAIALLEPDGALRLVGTHGVPAQVASQWQRIPPQTSVPLTDVVHSGEPVHLPDRAAFAARYPQVDAALMPGEQLWVVPLVDAQGATSGALAVGWPASVQDMSAAASFLGALAQLCGGAVPRLAARTARGALSGDEMWFRALLDSLLDPVLILAPIREAGTESAGASTPASGGTGGDHGGVTDFRIDYANAATVDLAGRTGADVVGRRMTDLYPGMVVSGVFGQLLDVQRTGTPYEGEAEQFIEMVSGHLRSSTMTLRAVRFLDGVLLSWRIHDEDERRAAQFAQAQRLANLGTWQYDMGTGETVWSPEMFTIIGLDRADGTPGPAALADAVAPDDLPAVEAVLHELLTEHRPQTLEFRVTRPDGRPCTVRAAAEAVCDPDGEEVLALRGVLQDVTAWRRTQDALADARDQLAEERGRTATQHAAVTLLQRAIIDVPPPSDPEVMRFAAHYVPAESIAQVGGDWYDRVTLPDGRILVAVGDVSGHGLPAAAGMTQVRHALRGMAYTGAEPAQILTWLNRMVCHQRSDYIATVICALVNPRTRTMTWSQAGHLPPLHVREGAPRVLQTPFGMVLGASSGAAYGSAVVDLAPGDMVLMYTDGLVEHRGADLGRGLSRLVGTVREGCDGELDACVEHVMRHLGTPNPQDDTCLIGFQIPGGK